MRTGVTFKSELFTPFLPEHSQVNPECYGAELAWWAAQELAKKGIITSYPNYEDWGWFIEYSPDDHEYWLCCGNVRGRNEWHIFLDCKGKGFFRRHKAPREEAEPLMEALEEILAECAAITNIQWHSETL